MQPVQRIAIGAAVVAAGWFTLSSPAMAQSSSACPSGRICASSPQSVMTALQNAGYKAKMTKDGAGDPMIETATLGYSYYVDFYGCEEAKNCTSLHFNILFAAKPEYTPIFVNNWNKAKRFGQMALQEDGELYISFDLLTTDGLTANQFKAVLETWDVTVNSLQSFLNNSSEHAADAADAT